MNKIQTELWQAYQETDFIAHDEPPFTLKIGEVCPALAHLYDRTNEFSATFITAYNPYSEALPAHKNQDRQNELTAQIKKRGLKFIEGIGQHPSGAWPGEPSLLVLGLDLEAAKTLGRLHGQNAIVWCGRDGLAGLVAP